MIDDDSNLIEHAKKELALAGYIPLDQDQPDDPNKWIQENVLELLSVFSKQGHSGSSAPYLISCFTKLANFEILTPLTGKDDEWIEHEDGVFQNNRCSHVFKKSKDGEAYDSEGMIFRRPSGSCYTSKESRTPVTFPYIPKRIYQDVAEDE